MKATRFSAFVWFGVLVGVALAAEFLFAQSAEGLLTPEGSVSAGTAALGALALVTRLAAVLGGPLLLGWTLAVAPFDRTLGRAAPPPPAL